MTPTPTDSRAARVCVVGAGPAGLVATKTLIGFGLDVDCFESSSAIGGHWVIDNPNGRAAAYRSLRTNTTKRMSGLSDYRMPEAWPEFPDHERVRAWLEGYVDHFGFRPGTCGCSSAPCTPSATICSSPGSAVPWARSGPSPKCRPAASAPC